MISGLTSSVEAVLATLAAQGIESQRLNVSHAFHSPLMEPMLDEFERIGRGRSLRAATHRPGVERDGPDGGRRSGVGGLLAAPRS